MCGLVLICIIGLSVISAVALTIQRRRQYFEKSGIMNKGWLNALFGHFNGQSLYFSNCSIIAGNHAVKDNIYWTGNEKKPPVSNAKDFDMKKSPY